MFPEQLKKILNLIKKTGERVIIFDAAIPDDSYALMDFDSYAELVVNNKSIQKNLEIKNLDKKVSDEKAVEDPKISVNSVEKEDNKNLTEEDLTDKINREISMWKNNEESPYLAEDNKPKKAWDISGQVKNKAQEVA